LPHNRHLSQHEIDATMARLKGADTKPASNAVPFDFRRPDRISKAQLRAIHVLHENFVRNLVSSLSAYLRTYVVINLISVEQLSYSEFVDGLPSPTCLVALGLKPYEGNAVLELNQSLVFPMLEILLGGTGRSNLEIKREISDIEKNVMDGLFRLVLKDLREAWRSVSEISFSIETLETEPQLLQLLAPTEAVVTVAIEVRLGDVSGMMNLAMPSILIKMMRGQFDHHWSMRRAEVTEKQKAHVRGLLDSALLRFDARLEGSGVAVRDLVELEEGEILVFDCPIDKPVDLLVNGRRKFKGQVVAGGRKRSFAVSGATREKALRNTAAHTAPDA
jgi:flagellar motor switch protein FliM